MPPKHRSQTIPTLGKTISHALSRIDELERMASARGGMGGAAGTGGGGLAIHGRDFHTADLIPASDADPVNKRDLLIQTTVDRVRWRNYANQIKTLAYTDEIPIVGVPIQGGAAQTDGTGKISVTFAQPYSSSPTVVATLVHGDFWDPLIHVVITSVSTTGFEAYVVQIQPQGSDPLSTWGAGGHQHGPGSYKFPATPTWGAGDHSHGVTGQTTVPEGAPGGAAGTYPLANGATNYLGSHTHPIPDVSTVGSSEFTGEHTHPIGDVFRHNHGAAAVPNQWVNWIAIAKTQ